VLGSVLGASDADADGRHPATTRSSRAPQAKPTPVRRLLAARSREPSLGLGVKAALADSALRGLDSGRAAARAATMGGLQPPSAETTQITRRPASIAVCRVVTGGGPSRHAPSAPGAPPMLPVQQTRSRIRNGSLGHFSRAHPGHFWRALKSVRGHRRAPCVVNATRAHSDPRRDREQLLARSFARSYRLDAAACAAAIRARTVARTASLTRAHRAETVARSCGVVRPAWASRTSAISSRSGSAQDSGTSILATAHRARAPARRQKTSSGSPVRTFCLEDPYLRLRKPSRYWIHTPTLVARSPRARHSVAVRMPRRAMAPRRVGGAVTGWSGRNPHCPGRRRHWAAMLRPGAGSACRNTRAASRCPAPAPW